MHKERAESSFTSYVKEYVFVEEHEVEERK